MMSPKEFTWCDNEVFSHSGMPLHGSDFGRIPSRCSQFLRSASRSGLLTRSLMYFCLNFWKTSSIRQSGCGDVPARWRHFSGLTGAGNALGGMFHLWFFASFFAQHGTSWRHSVHDCWTCPPISTLAFLHSDTVDGFASASRSGSFPTFKK